MKNIFNLGRENIKENLSIFILYIRFCIAVNKFDRFNKNNRFYTPYTNDSNDLFEKIVLHLKFKLKYNRNKILSMKTKELFHYIQVMV